jgi:hypothetical protein
MKSATIGLWVFAGLLGWSGTAMGHVPYLERDDFSDESPHRIRSVSQSVAVYAWLAVDDGQSDDVDVYRFALRRPERLYVHVLVPVCEASAHFHPTFAVVGPGLPEPTTPLPIDLDEGEGAVVVEHAADETTRPQFYEPFGGKSYFDGPVFDRRLTRPGDYRVCFWDREKRGGDYVAVFGYRERWGLLDILRALIRTPIIRLGWELHRPDCR